VQVERDEVEVLAVIDGQPPEIEAVDSHIESMDIVEYEKPVSGRVKPFNGH
jgi:hypothetical protein